MKIVLIHGDNKPKVQERTNSIVEGVRNKGWKIERVDKNTKLSETFTSTTLLPEVKLCILEGVSNLTKENVDWINNFGRNVEGSLLLIHSGDAPKKVLQPIKDLIKEEHFPLPKILFKYLETLKPGNAKMSLKMLHEMTETDSIELTLVMMGRHYRDLLWAKHDAQSMDYPEWRVKKLTTQANSYSDDQLNKVIERLAQADYDSKSGGSDLVTSLDLIIMRELA